MLCLFAVVACFAILSAARAVSSSGSRYHLGVSVSGTQAPLRMAPLRADASSVDSLERVESMVVGRGKSRAKRIKKILATSLMSASMMIPTLAPMMARADDELAKYAAEGNAVAVDGKCFLNKCSLETSKCTCLYSCVD